MTKRMLINASRRSEIRAAILDDDKLQVFEAESAVNLLKKGNIYLGRVTSVEPSLDACFVDYGAERDGFLHIWDVHPSCYGKKSASNSRSKTRIGDVMQRGQPVLVQVTKEEIGNKGAGLTTYISLPGRYFVFMPFDTEVKISRKLTDKERDRLRKVIEGMKDRSDGGLIVRSASKGQRKIDLERDLRLLIRLWEAIQKGSQSLEQPALIFRENDLVVRFMRDYYSADIKEIIIDSQVAVDRTDEYFRAVMVRQRPNILLYSARTPLFTYFDVERQIEEIYHRQVQLKSGGTIVIDQTEALIAIDVNSAKSRSDSDHEETAYHTNIEAAEEVARQLRLRDLGGIIVIDFIDMLASRHIRAVEKKFKDASKVDKARVDVAKISKNGLLELTRQRIKQSLWRQKYRTCPTCKGDGMIRSTESVWMSLLRRIEAEALNGTLYEVQASFHPELADYIQNARRPELLALEQEFGIRIIIRADSALHRSQEEVSFQHSSTGAFAKETPVMTPVVSLSMVELSNQQDKEDEEKPEVPESDDIEKSDSPSKKSVDKPSENRGRPRKRGRRKKNVPSKVNQSSDTSKQTAETKSPVKISSDTKEQDSKKEVSKSTQSDTETKPKNDPKSNNRKTNYKSRRRRPNKPVNSAGKPPTDKKSADDKIVETKTIGEDIEVTKKTDAKNTDTKVNPAVNRSSSRTHRNNSYKNRKKYTSKSNSPVKKPLNDEKSPDVKKPTDTKKLANTKKSEDIKKTTDVKKPVEVKKPSDSSSDAKPENAAKSRRRGSSRVKWKVKKRPSSTKGSSDTDSAAKNKPASTSKAVPTSDDNGFIRKIVHWGGWGKKENGDGDN